MALKKICVIGGGSWGTAIAKVISENIKESGKFHDKIGMYIYEEIIGGKKLSHIINNKHENIKYLPGVTLPNNIVANSNIGEVVNGSDVIVFVTPHQFVQNLCYQMKDYVKNSAICVSLIKGLDTDNSNKNNIILISNLIEKIINIKCFVLMGANIAIDVAKQQFCEATIGCNDLTLTQLLESIFRRPYFKISSVKDIQTVELCGALKNIVAMGAGFVDGLSFGGNTKAAVIRLGLKEIILFNKMFFEEPKTETFLESCCFADLVTTCYCGRNRKVAEAFVQNGGKKTMEELEEEILDGQKLQGLPTVVLVYEFLKNKNLLDSFPLFTFVYKISNGEISPNLFIECLKNHY